VIRQPLAAALLLLAASLVASSAPAASREEDLAALRSRISTLNAALEADARRAKEEASRLAERGSGLERALADRRENLGRLLAARSMAGTPDLVRVLLSGEDAGDIARRLYYLEQVSLASARAISEFQRNLVDLGALRHQALERSARLAEIDAQRRSERQRVAAERRERARVHARVVAEVRASRRRMEVLRGDEARLSRVVEEIGRVLASRPGAGHSYADSSAASGSTSARFASQRGRLGLPVSGTIAPRAAPPSRSRGRELATDSENPTHHSGEKGIFIRAGEGQPVRAIASGRVVFADWMRGFGNILILDHGESYLSVYGNAEALLKQVGESVRPGEQIATVGLSGGNEESGLYFELRHLGRAFDPLQWMRRK